MSSQPFIPASRWSKTTPPIPGWWFGGHFLNFPIYWESHHPNWLIFFRGVAQPPTRFSFMLPRKAGIRARPSHDPPGDHTKQNALLQSSISLGKKKKKNSIFTSMVPKYMVPWNIYEDLHVWMIFWGCSNIFHVTKGVLDTMGNLQSIQLVSQRLLHPEAPVAGTFPATQVDGFFVTVRSLSHQTCWGSTDEDDYFHHFCLFLFIFMMIIYHPKFRKRF